LPSRRTAPRRASRTSAGAEIDLLLALPRSRRWAIEVKRSSAPKVERGFHAACEDLKPDRQIVVYTGTERFLLGQGTEAVGVVALAEELRLLR